MTSESSVPWGEDDMVLSEHDDEEEEDHPHDTDEMVPPPLSISRDWVAAVFEGNGVYPAPDNRLKHEQKQGKEEDTHHHKHYQYTVSLPRRRRPASAPLGMTLCRLPLGVCVQSVQPNSEAALVGIQPGFVLVAMNNMHFLGEPTRRALERLWQYEGRYEDGGDAVGSSSSTRVCEPVVMTFFSKDKLLAPFVLLSQLPFGIEWGPCIHVPLIKRVTALAKDAGVQPGSLLLQVDALKLPEASFEQLTKALVKEQIGGGTSSMQLTFGYTPSCSRTADYERRKQYIEQTTQQQHETISSSNGTSILATKKAPVSPMLTKSYDGVTVKFHPLNLAFCALNPSTRQRNHNSQRRTMARFVATGNTKKCPPAAQTTSTVYTSTVTQDSLFSACPSVTGIQLLQSWDPLGSLLYCIQLAVANYSDERLVNILSSNNDKKRNSDNDDDAAIMATLTQLAAKPTAYHLVGAFLLQFIGVICAPLSHGGDAGASSMALVNGNDDEKKMDEYIVGATRGKGTVASGAVPSQPDKKLPQELTSILLKISRKDDGFCQKLYFLLRSYISTLETPRPTSVQPDGSRNLMALLNCLELLRFAEKELANRSPGTMRRPPNLASSLRALSPTRSAASTVKTVQISPRTRTVTTPSAHSPRKKKSIFGRFRRKKKTTQQIQHQPETTASAGTPYSPSIGRGGTEVSRALSESQLDKYSASSAASTLVRPTSPRAITQLSPRQHAFIESPSIMYENMSDFLGELDRICQTIERALQKSFRQKMADWAMQPWSPIKDTALGQVTELMRNSLKEINTEGDSMLLCNPVDSSELLSSVDYDECYILPSAHFPILLTFNVSERRSSDLLTGEERLYRTKVELLALKGRCISGDDNSSFIVDGAVAGTVLESGPSQKLTSDGKQHTWKKMNKSLIFDARSSWGAPQTLSLRLSSRKRLEDGSLSEEVEELGFGWLDLSQLFNNARQDVSMSVCTADIWPLGPGVCTYDEHGHFHVDGMTRSDRYILEVKITTESIGFGGEGDASREALTRKRMLLYKHDDDLRQEAFAVQFINTCDAILKASGLDMKLLSFQCIPVGARRGFVEWVPGSVPLSEICQPVNSTATTPVNSERPSIIDTKYQSTPSKAGLTKYESLRRLGGQQNGTFRQKSGQPNVGRQGSFANNPIQDYLRSVAFDPTAPYMIRKNVMDTYIKSAAGYSVITYILGVGDRHLDNLLLHQSGAFFHCDFSFILGSDPKTYLPVRVTEDMIHGMGGLESDNYARFLSAVGASFLVLRRPENARLLLSMVRLLEFSCIPDISENQRADQAVFGMRDRLRLELSDQDAVSFIENLVESSQASKMWMAVDVIHNFFR